MDTLKFIGFLLLSVSFLIHATFVEQIILSESLWEANLILTLSSFFRLAGYLTLVVALIKEPLQTKPKATGVFLLPGVTIFLALPLSLPILAALVGFLYLRKATIGLEHHLKPLALGFFILSLSELFSLSFLFRNTDNIYLYNLVAPFKIFWLAEHFLLLSSMATLGLWGWQYLLKRILSQLFMIFTASSLIIFLLTTMTLTTLLLRSLENDALKHLETDVSLFNYVIQIAQEANLADAQMLAQDPLLQSALASGDRKKLRELTNNAFLSKKQTFLWIASADASVIFKAEDPEKLASSLSSDSLFQRALAGEGLSSVVTSEAVLTPEVSLRSAAPIKSGESIIGVVMVGKIIDNAFVDGLKEATKIDISVYADNIRSATTFIAPDKKSRWVGIKEETPLVKKTVLEEGKPYNGQVEILNVPYFAAYLPLEDMDNNPVGMLFVGRPQISVLQTAGRSIQLTFLVTVLMLILSILPTYVMAKYLTNQLK